MVLSNVDIALALKQKRFVIDPEPQAQDYQTSAVDLHLAEDFFAWDYKKVEQAARGLGHEIVIDLSRFKYLELAREFLPQLSPDSDGAILLNKHDFLLATTAEKVGNRDPGCCLAARVEGRSSLARLGLQIHMTAPTIHAGFFGNITLEIFNAGPFPLKLRPGLPICQLIVEEVSSPPSGDMERHTFQGQTTPRGA